jgi:radical SAM protein with 4Fe4S-binding SPASM domain
MKIKHWGNFQSIASPRCAMDAMKYSDKLRLIKNGGEQHLEECSPVPLGEPLSLISNLRRIPLSQESILYISTNPFSWFVADVSAEKDLTNLVRGIPNSPELDQKAISKLYHKGLLKLNGTTLSLEELSGRYAVRSDNVALISITDKCNLSCNHCVANANSNKLIGPEIQLEELQELFKSLSDEKNPYGLDVEKKVFISGGEPLVRKDLEAIALSCSEEGLSTNICTNGLLITHNLLDNLKGKNISFSVSLDGEKENHELIRGRGTYEPTIETIKAMRKRGFRVFLNNFLHERNISDMNYLLQFGAEIGIEGINFIRAIPRGRGRDMDFKRVPDEKLFKEVYSFMKKDETFYRMLENENTFPILAVSAISGIKSLNCGMSRGNYFFLDSVGDVYPCPGTRYEEFKIGNIRNQNFSEILDRRKSHPLSSLRVDEFEGCSPCDFIYFCGGDCRGSAYGNSLPKDIKSVVPYCNERKDSLLSMFRILGEDPLFLKTKSEEIIKNARQETRLQNYR